MRIFDSNIRTSLPDSAALPASAIFSRSFTAFKPSAAFRLAEILRRLGSLGCYMNLVERYQSVVGCFYRSTTFASLAVFRGPGEFKPLPAFSFSKTLLRYDLGL